MTQHSDQGEHVRRRVCLSCGHRFWSQQPAEQLLSQYAIEWGVKNRGGYVKLLRDLSNPAGASHQVSPA